MKQLLESEIDASLRDYFSFGSQRLGPAGYAEIEKICKLCGNKKYISVARIRADLKRGRRQTGMCGECLKKPGVHQRGLRKPTSGDSGFKTVHGYVSVYRPEHPNASKSGHVPQHRLVMEEVIGRYLLPTETVHHKNGVRDDNAIENLQLRQGQHGAGQKWSCLDCGGHNILATELD